MTIETKRVETKSDKSTITTTKKDGVDAGHLHRDASGQENRRA